LSAERTVLVTVTARVEAIDQANRDVTLRGPLGNVVIYTEALAISLQKSRPVGKKE
jgi:hypothetical protein